MRVIGLMSGTSYDAIDAAAADLAWRGDTVVLSPLGVLSRPYPAQLREAVGAALPPAPTTMEQLCRLDTGIGQAFAAVAGQANEQLCDGAADLVVSHGQTLFHWVEAGQVRGTLQLGQPAWIPSAPGCRWSRTCASATSPPAGRERPWSACSTCCGSGAGQAPRWR